MDTHGHESCAQDAGLGQLTAALERVGKSGWRLGAFYLGNWLTDVSQTVDPVAYYEGSTKITGIMDGVINGVRTFEISPEWAWRPVRDLVVRGLESMRGDLVNALGLLGDAHASDRQRSYREGDAAKACKKAFFVMGYYKFVHPRKEHPGERERIHYAAYKHVFSHRYTQYYPHEHLDRWPPSLTEKGGYAGRRVTGTLSADGRGTGNRSLSPHMYGYLRDDLEIAAGLLAQVDNEWARRTFSRGGPWGDDSDNTWNEWLAKLGHAMHGLEDYFAHSNFIEFALRDLPDAEQFVPPPDGMLTLPGSEASVFQKRLKRFSGTTDDNDRTRWRQLAAEDHVVTGYFDFTDTFHSVQHVLTDLWDKHQRRGGGGGPGWDKQIGRLMRRTIEDVQTRLRDQSSVTPAQARDAAREVLTGYVTHGDPDAREAADELLNHAPADIRDGFFEAVGLFCKRVPGIALSIYDAFETLGKFIDFIESPLRWIEEVLRLVPEIIANAIRENIIEPLERKVKQLLDHYLLGRFRVGCHSLMAKDYNWERPHIDRIYAQAKNCAKAVHWYVIKGMTRWSAPASAAMARQPNAGTAAVTIDLQRSIDWLELVEFFLRHPHGTPAPRWWEPVVRGSYQNFPGYNGTSPQRARLPHQLVFLTPDEAQALRDRGGQGRQQAEQRYRP
jgi:hypothetical protein